LVITQLFIAHEFVIQTIFNYLFLDYKLDPVNQLIESIKSDKIFYRFKQENIYYIVFVQTNQGKLKS
jgi:hypothetical protein